MNKLHLTKNYKIQYWFAFLQAFPILMIVVNLSFFVFFRLFFSFRNISIIKITSPFQILAICFGIGALVSTLNSYDLNSSLIVLPNYFYWTFLIILFYNYRNSINFEVIREAIFKGLILVNLYYWIIEKTFNLITPYNKSIGENGYAILMVSFFPIALKYLLVKIGKKSAYFFAIISIVLGFASGSRAGALLITLGALLTIFGKNLSFGKILQLATICTILYLFLFKTDFASNLLYTIDADVHAVIYKSTEVFEEDQSMLIRRAMVEKGLILFEDDPLTGLGLNNWQEYEVKFRGNFVGAENIIYKPRIEKFSAHNSYIAFLGEGGLLLFVPFVLLLFYTIFRLLIKFDQLDEYQQPILWSLIMMSIHIYFISAMLNSFTWYLISLGVAAAGKDSYNKSI